MEDVLVFSQVLKPVLKHALEKLVEENSQLLSADVCRQLLQGPESSAVETDMVDEISPPVFERGLVVVGGYPQYPLCERLCMGLSYWIVRRTCPTVDLPVMYMLNEDKSIVTRRENMEKLDSKLLGFHSLWELWSEDEKLYTILEVLKELTLRGVLDLLGVRCTVGSVDMLPPSQEVLLATFNSIHHPSAKLTVGGRALTKHSHRDSTENWWGTCTGSEDAKNRHALKLALRILRAATWINIHQLPHDVKVIEVRTVEGYGVRWTHDGSEFRGFLEPQMADGHVVGWKH